MENIAFVYPQASISAQNFSLNMEVRAESSKKRVEIGQNVQTDPLADLRAKLIVKIKKIHEMVTE